MSTTFGLSFSYDVNWVDLLTERRFDAPRRVALQVAFATTSRCGSVQ
jgi:hypothetical protein